VFLFVVLVGCLFGGGVQYFLAMEGEQSYSG